MRNTKTLQGSTPFLGLKRLLRICFGLSLRALGVTCRERQIGRGTSPTGQQYSKGLFTHQTAVVQTGERHRSGSSTARGESPARSSSLGKGKSPTRQQQALVFLTVRSLYFSPLVLCISHHQYFVFLTFRSSYFSQIGPCIFYKSLAGGHFQVKFLRITEAKFFFGFCCCCEKHKFN